MIVDPVESSPMNPPAASIEKETKSKRGVKRDTANENSDSENEKLTTCETKKSRSTGSASKAEINAYKATIEEQNRTILEQNRTITNLIEQITSIIGRLNKLEANAPKTAQTGQKTFADLFTPKRNDEDVLLLSRIQKERNESARIEKNVIITGLSMHGSNKEEIDSNDKGEVTKVLTKLGAKISDIKRTSRITNTQQQEQQTPKLILVEFNEITKKEEVCKKAHTLRKAGDEFKGIYVNEDKTESQRKLEKELREERNRRNNELEVDADSGRHLGTHNNRKFSWGIRSSELRRIFI